jgi:hypothetical protein
MCASCEKEEQTLRLINEIASEWSEKVKVKSEIGEMKKKKIHWGKESRKRTYQGLHQWVLHLATHSKEYCIHKAFWHPKSHGSNWTIPCVSHAANGKNESTSQCIWRCKPNFLVEGTEWENRIVEFKSRRGWKPFAADGFKNPTLGARWNNGFWKHHGHEIEKKKRQKFSKDWSEWFIHQNFVQMYDEVKVHD